MTGSHAPYEWSEVISKLGIVDKELASKVHGCKHLCALRMQTS